MNDEIFEGVDGIAMFHMPGLQRENFPDDETFAQAVASQKRRESESDDKEIDITGFDKIDVVLALYKAASKLGMGFLQPDLSDQDVRNIFAKFNDFDQSNFPYVDYLGGKPLKVHLASDTFDGRLYDRDHGQGAARRVVESLRT